jgi:hypothetical protein
MMQPKTKTILFILLSFVLGILGGWFIKDYGFIKPEHSPGDFQKMLSERLHLDEHQIVQVDSLLEIRRQQMDVYRKQMFAMRDTTQMEIRKFLNINQNKLFDAVIQEMNNREAKKREHEGIKK